MTVRSRLVLTTLAIGFVAIACSRQSASPQTSDTSSGPARTAGASRAPHGAQAPATMPEMRPSRTHSAASAPRTVTGTVLETMDAANYTYVRVKTDTEEVWAATSKVPVKTGERVTVPLEMAMENFHSKALNRDFPVIYFVSQIGRDQPSTAAAVTTGQSPHGMAQPSAADRAPVTTPMPPPAGGSTIASVWANRASLVGKPVTVRGKVVKYNGGILGVNWLHIQDGTGDAKAGTNDLTITTNDEARVGDVVTATGTVAADKDFGAGYAYKVIVEKSTLKQ